MAPALTTGPYEVGFEKEMAPRSGFGPESRARQARMIGRYTTGA